MKQINAKYSEAENISFEIAMDFRFTGNFATVVVNHN